MNRRARSPAPAQGKGRAAALERPTVRSVQDAEPSVGLPSSVGTGGFGLDDLLVLQRTVGNRAVQRLLAVGGDRRGRGPRTGALPGALRAGLERLSGFDLSGVRVHYDSPRPPRVGALAYTRGREIHLGSGAEKHLAHEGWHVVQQMQGRVRPTGEIAGVAVNDDAGLEREAERMGERALRTGATRSAADPAPAERRRGPVVQRAETVPPPGTRAQVKKILLKLAALIQEAEARMTTLQHMRELFASLRGVFETGEAVEPDFDLRRAALDVTIAGLHERLALLRGAQEDLAQENKSKTIEAYTYPVQELEDVANWGNLVASDPELEEATAWFGEELVARRKKGQKQEGAATPSVTPADPTGENVKAFVELPAAPMLDVDFGTLMQGLGGYFSFRYQGDSHSNKEGNLPGPRFSADVLDRAKSPFIELSISVGVLSGGRAVFDVASGAVYVTEHYGQNIAKPIEALRLKTGQAGGLSQGEGQRLHALLLLKKVLNDFVRVSNVPAELYAAMRDTACKAFLKNYLAVEHFNPPAACPLFQAWCGDLSEAWQAYHLRQTIAKANPVSFTRWMRYFNSMAQLFPVDDDLPAMCTFGVLTAHPEIAVAHHAENIVDLARIPAQFGEVGLVTTRRRFNEVLCYVRAGLPSSPEWKFFAKRRAASPEVYPIEK